ncbi:hypothetical protein G9A89_010757 [Geosiphon pyriformis]|nr:hypothetical protein G9A89_010757 [Geosiphon pyriformis]
MVDLVTARWSVLVGKDFVRVAKAIGDKQMWVSKDQHQALLYTLPVRITAYDLSSLLESYGRKTCFIGCNPFLYVRNWYAVICFKNEVSKLAAVGLIPVFKSVNLCWAGLCLAYCTQCTHFGHITANCSLSVTPPSQNQEEDIVIGVGLGESTCDKSAAATATITATYTAKNFFMFPHVVKLENMLKGLAVLVLNLNSGHMGSGVAIIMDLSLVKHVCKVLKMSSWLLLVKLLFRNRLSVSILGLYVGASLTVYFFQADKINFLIAKAVNESSFIILGGDFNKDRSHKCASFKKCFDLDLVNSLGGSSLDKLPTWCNSCGVAKTINYVFLSSNLVNVIMDHGMLDVDNFFDTNHKTVSVSVGLGGLLDTRFSLMHKQANKNCWKFGVKNVNKLKWTEFKDGMAANASMFSNAFVAAGKFSDLDAITFKKKWFKGFDSVFNKVSSRFYKLELLVSKLVKTSHLISEGDFALLLNTWDRLDSVDTLSVKSLFLSGSGFNGICSELAKARKSYRSSKMLESKCAEKSHIRQAIENRMESFELDKSCTIRSVLECPFHKVVLDHLVVADELVLKLELVKSKVDRIMEGWTRRWLVVSDFSDNWKRQFRPLDYIFDGAFSGVMNLISFDEMFSVILSLPDGKAAGLSGISNELSWRKAWVSMISKPYEWEGVLTNTHPIALIETAHKILSKILSDRISSACNEFDVLQGDNFSVLKGTTMQSPIFAIGSVVKNVLEKNRELWLVLQNMCKAYDSVDWEHLERSLIKIKMCNSSQAATQHILDVASEFFRINDILINNNKTVAILINCQVETPYLTVSGLPIFIVKKGEPHCLKSKSGLPLDFLNDALHHLSLYDLKTFEQIQAESKLVSAIVFANSVAGVVCIFSEYDLSLACAFHHRSGTPMFLVLGKINFLKCVSSFKRYGIAFVEQLHNQNGVVFSWQTFKCWKRLDPCGPIPFWFDFSACFLGGVASSPVCFSFVRNSALPDVH